MAGGGRRGQRTRPQLSGLRGCAMSGEPGLRMHALSTELFPICRGITGDGVRQSLRLIGERISLDVHEVPTGTPVLDWTVPDEWNVREAYIRYGGRPVVDLTSS